MSNKKEYNGSIEVISGFKQANGQDFPLMEASAIQVDDEGKRLDEKLEEMCVQAEEKFEKLDAKVDEKVEELTVNLENGTGENSLKQKGGKASATGEGAVALNGGYKVEEDGTETEGVRANGKWSIAGGKDTETYQRCSTAIGGGNKAGLTEDEFKTKYTSGTDEHGKTYEESYSFATAEGVTTIATGYAAHAENESTEAAGHRSHASGQETHATGNRSFATGYKTYAKGMNSFTMGEDTQAEKTCTFAGGIGSQAKGDYSFAFGGKGTVNENGNPTTASGKYSVAFGCGNTASASWSYVIGLDNTASGNVSFAGGWNCQALKLNAVAIGQDSVANGERAVVFGWGHNSTINDSFACGFYSQEVTDNIFRVGNGTKASPSNAFVVLKNGRAKVYGAPKDPQDVVRLGDISTIPDKVDFNDAAKAKWQEKLGIFELVANSGSNSISMTATFDIKKAGNKLKFRNTSSSGLTMIDWGDGSVDAYATPPADGEIEHYFTVAGIYTVKVYGVTSIGYYSFMYDDGGVLMSVVIHNNVTSIGYFAFWSNSKLTSVVIPDSVTSIGENAFNNCTSLKSVVIPDSVTSIGNAAFAYCSSLTKVVIGGSVTSIGKSVFLDCNNLTRVEIEGNNFLQLEGEVLGNGTTVYPFDGCAEGLKIIIKNPSLLDTYKTADVWSRYASMLDTYVLKSELPEQTKLYRHDIYFKDRVAISEDVDGGDIWNCHLTLFLKSNVRSALSGESESDSVVSFANFLNLNNLYNIRMNCSGSHLIYVKAEARYSIFPLDSVKFVIKNVDSHGFIFDEAYYYSMCDPTKPNPIEKLRPSHLGFDEVIEHTVTEVL